MDDDNDSKMMAFQLGRQLLHDKEGHESTQGSRLQLKKLDAALLT